MLNKCLSLVHGQDTYTTEEAAAGAAASFYVDLVCTRVYTSAYHSFKIDKCLFITTFRLYRRMKIIIEKDSRSIYVVVK